MMDKAADAFRTISEVAEDLDIPQHVLRFWETKFTHIKPLKRGGGRRYYRPDDVDLVRGIRHLLYGQGYTIKGVQRIIKEQGIKIVMAAWKDTGDQAASINFESKSEELHPFEDSALISEELITAIETYDINPLKAEQTGHQPFQHRSDVSIMRGGISRVSAQVVEPPHSTRKSAQNNVSGLSETDHASLMGALQDLAECRRILDAAGRS